ncbi:hypothetical protein EAN93_29390 [Klebsiella pneumoniae]|nr:hypothetical protein EAN93_29390 [Klebsiella pneumoniae]
MYTEPAAKQTCSISSLKTCTVTDKTHPLYDERVHLPIEEGMVLNIAELGVLEPIIVWKDPETGLTCVVVGRQRVKHTGGK